MRKTAAVLIFLVSGFLVAAQGVLASGFYNNQQGAASTAMGGASEALVHDASVLYFNPAGIVELQGFNAMAGLSVFSIHGKFKSDAGQTDKLERALIPMPHFFATYKATPNLAFGIGEFTDFGLKTDWKDSWEGRFITGATFSEIQTININPVAAYKITPGISLGAGPVIRYIDIDLRNQMPNLLGGFGIGPSPLLTPETGVKLTGDDWAFGYAVGLMAQITRNLNFGAVYRSKTEHNIKGDFKIQDAGVNGYTDSRFSADVTLPAYANAGLSYKLGKLTIAGGLMWTNWSSYDRLEAVFSHNQGVPGINETDRLSSDKKWDDTLAYKFGIEYAISDAWDLRAGILFDPTPVPDHTLDPLVPSGDRWDYSIGFGYKKKALRIDCAYLLVTDEGRRFDNAVSDQSAYGLPNVTGKFDDFVVHALTVNVNYTF